MKHTFFGIHMHWGDPNSYKQTPMHTLKMGQEEMDESCTQDQSTVRVCLSSNKMGPLYRREGTPKIRHQMQILMQGSSQVLTRC